MSSAQAKEVSRGWQRDLEKVFQFFRGLRKDEGQGLTGYALIIALVALAVIAALALLGENLTDSLSDSTDSLSGRGGRGPPQDEGPLLGVGAGGKFGTAVLRKNRLNEERSGEMKRFIQFLKDRKGQGLTEYALIITLVAIAVIAALTLLGGGVTTTLNNIVGSL